tara:strand:+ start:41 stop:385 length:345 start_codon:yes stop_codon:yes gene_type:complete
MAHFAKVNQGIVEKVIVAEQDFVDNIVDDSPGEYIQTSYNTFGGVHLNGGTPLRKNYAQVGGNYDYANDAFYDHQPYTSWTLNNTSYIWEPPVAYPDDDKQYTWNETDQTWDEV